ncbi:hypothetical protein Tco_0336192 [Tanacetum coccineum]
MKPVPKEKKVPNTFSGEYLCQLSHGYKVLVAKYEKLTEEQDKLTKRDQVSHKLINSPRSENATQKEKLELLEKENKELKSQLYELQTQKMQLEGRIEGIKSELWLLKSEKVQLDKLKTYSEKGFKTDKKKMESRIESLVKQCNEEKRNCSATGNELAELRKRYESKCIENQQLQSKVKQTRINEDLFKQEGNKVVSLEAKLNEQREYVLILEVQNIIDDMKIAHKKVLAAMEEAHNLEMLAIITDQENKGRSAKKGKEMKFLKDLRADTEEAFKRLGVIKKERRNGDESDDNVR